MGKVEPLTIIDDPSAWLARDYPDPAAYAYHLTPADLAELDAAVASASAAVAAGKEVQVRDPAKAHVWQQVQFCGYHRTVCVSACHHLLCSTGIRACSFRYWRLAEGAIMTELLQDPYQAHVWMVAANHQGRVPTSDPGRKAGDGP